MAKACKRSGGCNSHMMQHQVIHQTSTRPDGCPIIQLNELSANSVIEDLPFDSEILISAGATPHSLGLISGTYPPGFGLIYTHGAWHLYGTCDTPGVYVFVLGGLDANGCPIDHREYTFTVEEAATPV